MLTRLVVSVLETCQSVLVSESDTVASGVLSDDKYKSVVDTAIDVLFSVVVSNREFVDVPVEESNCVFVVESDFVGSDVTSDETSTYVELVDSDNFVFRSGEECWIDCVVFSLEKGALGLVSKTETVCGVVDSGEREVYIVSVVSPLVVSTCALAVWSL